MRRLPRCTPVTDHVEPRATVITDGWPGYSGLEKLGYVHDRRSQRAARACGEDPGALLPAVHRVHPDQVTPAVVGLSTHSARDALHQVDATVVSEVENRLPRVGFESEQIALARRYIRRQCH